jgi:PPM family protein phosphatase
MTPTKRYLKNVKMAALSDVGKARAINEDSFGLFPDKGLMIVSDGIGGRSGGHLASKLAVQLTARYLSKSLTFLDLLDPEAAARLITDATLKVNAAIKDRGETPGANAGMGTTLVAAFFLWNEIIVCSVGDSRAYLFREGRLSQLTEDHSMVRVLLKEGLINSREASSHPSKGQLARYLGMEGELVPDLRRMDLVGGDIILLCTDGLTNEVPDTVIAETLSASDNPEQICARLVDSAMTAGARDNITVAVAVRT